MAATYQRRATLRSRALGSIGGAGPDNEIRVRTHKLGLLYGPGGGRGFSSEGGPGARGRSLRRLYVGATTSFGGQHCCEKTLRALRAIGGARCADHRRHRAGATAGEKSVRRDVDRTRSGDSNPAGGYDLTGQRLWNAGRELPGQLLGHRHPTSVSNQLTTTRFDESTGNPRCCSRRPVENVGRDRRGQRTAVDRGENGRSGGGRRKKRRPKAPNTGLTR